MKDDRIYLSHIRDAIVRSDELIHEYFGVDLKIVWNIVKNEISRLKEKVDLLLKS